MSNYEVFKEYTSQTPGIWFYAPKRGKYHEGKASHGFGMIKYSEGSVYCGEIFYDGKEFHKIGQGYQDFSSWRPNLDKEYHSRVSRFVGSFDYRKTDWIYGNGTLYLVDEFGNPSYFVKGFFAGLTKSKNYVGDYDYSKLLPGYQKSMEIEFFKGAGVPSLKDRFVLPLKGDKVALLGDSYFDFMRDEVWTGVNNTFDIRIPLSVDYAIGGTRFTEWNEDFKDLVFDLDPEIMVFNLGTNDFNSGLRFEKVKKDFKELIKSLHTRFPYTKLYFTTICLSPYLKKYDEKKDRFNQYLFANKEGLNYKVIDVSCALKSELRYYCSDLLHPSQDGYNLIYDLINEAIHQD